MGIPERGMKAMAGTKTVYVTLTEEEHARLTEAKGGRTWREVLIDGADA